MIQALGFTFIVTIALVILWHLKWILLAAVGVYAVFKVSSAVKRRRMRQRAARAAAMAALVERADRQHREMMLGDPDAGTYGDFPPPPEVLPVDLNQQPHEWE